MPSFGDWGFSLIARSPLERPQALSRELPRPEELRFLSSELVPTPFAFPADQQRLELEVNRLDTQRLVRYYDQDLSSLGPMIRRTGS